MAQRKKILILGGSVNQVPLILSAKREGYYVVLCDWDYNNPGVPLADKHYLVSALNREKNLQIAIDENVDGVISNSEATMPVVAYISEQLGLVGNKEKSIEILQSKSLFRDLQDELGLYVPKHIVISSAEEAIQSIQTFSFPVIIKPVESSGSRGTTKISEFDETLLRDSVEENISFSRNGKCQIEEYVKMPDLSVLDGDIFVMGESIIWDGLFLSVRNSNAPFVPMAQLYPLILDDDRMRIVKDTLTSIIRGAGITHGEYNVEMYFSNEGKLFVIEINARQGGCAIPQMIEKHCGVDMTRLLVTTCVGDMYYLEELEHTIRKTKNVARLYVFSYTSGCYKDLFISDKIRPFVTGIEMEVEKGSTVHPCSNAESVIGYVNLEFASASQQAMYFQNISKEIYPIVD